MVLDKVFPPAVAALLFGMLFLSPSANAQASRLALVGGTVISATGEAPQKNTLILISDGTIEYVGSEPAGMDLSAYDVVDISGQWVTPGLIDTNVHLILNTVPEFYIKYEERLEDIAIQSAQVALQYGLTTIADTWGPLEPLLAAREWWKKSEQPAFHSRPIHSPLPVLSKLYGSSQTSSSTPTL